MIYHRQQEVVIGKRNINCLSCNGGLVEPEDTSAIGKNGRVYKGNASPKRLSPEAEKRADKMLKMRWEFARRSASKSASLKDKFRVRMSLADLETTHDGITPSQSFLHHAETWVNRPSVLHGEVLAEERSTESDQVQVQHRPTLLNREDLVGNECATAYDQTPIHKVKHQPYKYESSNEMNQIKVMAAKRRNIRAQSYAKDSRR